jgi:mRNA-degrading endonuclease RelE of RelBE toxin-antitoxin system
MTISEQLSHTPLEVTRNRKPLEQPAPFGATWELRFGNKNSFRVFYEVDAVDQIVLILAIGIKDREKLLVSGEEIEI